MQKDLGSQSSMMRARLKEDACIFHHHCSKLVCPLPRFSLKKGKCLRSAQTMGCMAAGDNGSGLPIHSFDSIDDYCSKGSNSCRCIATFVYPWLDMIQVGPFLDNCCMHLVEPRQ